MTKRNPLNAMKFKIPNTHFIVFSIIVIVAAATWIIPGGEYTKVLQNGKETVVADSFHYVESQPQGFAALLKAPIRGFINAAGIIAFVLIVGGAFSIMQRTAAIDVAITHLVHAHDRFAIVRMFLIPLLMLLFSAGGAVFGMSEEIIPFVLIFVPLALKLGYDSVVGVAIPYVGSHVGFAAAFLNPFTVGIAQGLSGLPLFSGIGFRVIVWLLFTGIAILFVSMYTRKLRKNPGISPMAGVDELNHADAIENSETPTMRRRHQLVLAVFTAGMLLLVFGVLQYKWYIEEIAALFFALGIVIAIAGRLSINETTDAFISGAKDLVGTALIIGFARGILIVAQDGMIIDTVLYNLSSTIGSDSPIMASQTMILVQTMINFFIPSGSGQAALTMPIMAPLSDLLNVSRQTAVLAYQFGDGFSNMIYPTSPVLMGTLSLAKIPWQKWARWILPLQLFFLLLAMLLMIPAYYLHW
ncbi:MAG: putative basic amino acid antiporter YfcC [Calditrichaeota bacterium]|nr:MAG: putative basic amino acid antiporter YfcC [Calditrichota bacterium]